MIDEKKLISKIKDAINSDKYNGYTPKAVLFEVYDIIQRQPKIREWIQFKIVDDIVVSKTPDDNEEIFVSDGEHVWDDTFVDDGIGCYLDGYGGALDGLAWMAKPEPWEGAKDDK